MFATAGTTAAIDPSSSRAHTGSPHIRPNTRRCRPLLDVVEEWGCCRPAGAVHLWEIHHLDECVRNYRDRAIDARFEGNESAPAAAKWRRVVLVQKLVAGPRRWRCAPAPTGSGSCGSVERGATPHLSC